MLRERFKPLNIRKKAKLEDEEVGTDDKRPLRLSDLSDETIATQTSVDFHSSKKQTPTPNTKASSTSSNDDEFSLPPMYVEMWEDLQ